LALNNRAHAYRGAHQYDRALADYEAAARIDPKSTQHRNMGFTLFFIGQMTESADAMKRAVDSTQDMYAMLFRYIALTKQGQSQSALRELEENAAKVKENHWPLPIIHFYLGKIDEKAVFAAAETTDAKKRAGQVCESNFFAAEARLLKGKTDEGLPMLQTAEKECPPTFYEAHAARAELKRLVQR
jgi:lipoprotein NlpI